MLCWLNQFLTTTVKKIFIKFCKRLTERKFQTIPRFFPFTLKMCTYFAQKLININLSFRNLFKTQYKSNNSCYSFILYKVSSYTSAQRQLNLSLWYSVWFHLQSIKKVSRSGRRLTRHYKSLHPDDHRARCNLAFKTPFLNV